MGNMYIFICTYSYSRHKGGSFMRLVDYSWNFTNKQPVVWVGYPSCLWPSLTYLAPPTAPWQELVHRLSKLQEAREKLLEAENVADTEIAKLDKIIDDMENQLPGWMVTVEWFLVVVFQYLYIVYVYSSEGHRERDFVHIVSTHR